ncbi:hypothetical protein D9Q98_010334 [Chlorella vulgaris]|uniref:C2H2-type domain-containing protein n=1 Tax=Chlorella vulgaris TaxID=3077 RepID=A0A9D4TJZ5_CHLVU|nr:hypothetical protein D9Q98_010334 [Chlorella vulgaris]
MHDSFFAAQAARRMAVYLCLVEGCPRKFCTVEERKQHLADHHKFPRHFNFDRLHLRRRKAQIRPLPRGQRWPWTHAASVVVQLAAAAADAVMRHSNGCKGDSALPVVVWQRCHEAFSLLSSSFLPLCLLARLLDIEPVELYSCGG